MADSIDSWYQRELEYLRSAGADFAARYGKIADRLSLSATGTQDPHVERLLQGVAFLNARIRQKLDDGFPELVDSLLGVLYPHLVAPIPSMSIVQLDLGPHQKELLGGHVVPRGTMLESERIDGQGAQYQTCFDLKLLPVQLTAVELVGPPFPGPLASSSRSIEAALHVQLVPNNEDVTFADFSFQSLQFYIDMGNFQQAARLMEFLQTQCHEIVIADSTGRGIAAVWNSRAIRQSGLAADSAILPERPQSFSGYRLLTEHFVLPQRSLFFELTGFTPQLLAKTGKQLDIWIYLKKQDHDLASLVRRDSLKLGCTPIINLFRETADAVPLSILNSEYRLIPDARAEDYKEVYTVDEVLITDGEDQEEELFPFYSVTHTSSESRSYWHAVRRPGPQVRDMGPIDSDSEVFVSIVDEGFQLLSQNQGYLQAQLTCFNRVIPEMLSKRELSQIRFSFAGGTGPVSRIGCLVTPTRTIRRHMGAENLWPFVSQLSLNHLSLTGPEGVVALREILKLNDPRGSAQSDRIIEGILSVTSEPCIQRLGDVFARGTKVHLLLDQESFTGDSAFLLCSILDHFLGMYTSLNSFIQLSAIVNEAQEKGVAPWKWEPKIGSRSLI